MCDCTETDYLLRKSFTDKLGLNLKAVKNKLEPLDIEIL